LLVALEGAECQDFHEQGLQCARVVSSYFTGSCSLGQASFVSLLSLLSGLFFFLLSLAFHSSSKKSLVA
jgi:hypothetical protein